MNRKTPIQLLSGGKMDQKSSSAQPQGTILAAATEEAANIRKMLLHLEQTHKDYGVLLRNPHKISVIGLAARAKGDVGEASVGGPLASDFINRIKAELADRLCHDEEKWIHIFGPDKLAEESARWFRDENLNALDPVEAARKYFASIIRCWNNEEKCWRQDNSLEQAALFGAYYKFYLARIKGNPNAIPKADLLENGIRNLAKFVRDEMNERMKNGRSLDSLSLPPPFRGAMPAGTV
jgi:hypothetical protein